MKSVEHTGMAENRNCRGPWSPPSGSRDGIHQVVQVAAPDCNADHLAVRTYARAGKREGEIDRESERGRYSKGAPERKKESDGQPDRYVSECACA